MHTIERPQSTAESDIIDRQQSTAELHIIDRRQSTGEWHTIGRQQGPGGAARHPSAGGCAQRQSQEPQLAPSRSSRRCWKPGQTAAPWAGLSPESHYTCKTVSAAAWMLCISSTALRLPSVVPQQQYSHSRIHRYHATPSLFRLQVLLYFTYVNSWPPLCMLCGAIHISCCLHFKIVKRHDIRCGVPSLTFQPCTAQHAQHAYHEISMIAGITSPQQPWQCQQQLLPPQRP